MSQTAIKNLCAPLRVIRQIFAITVVSGIVFSLIHVREATAQSVNTDGGSDTTAQSVNADSGSDATAQSVNKADSSDATAQSVNKADSSDALLLSLENDYSQEAGGFPDVHDPFEPVNRVVFDFNLLLDRIILRPVAKTYRHVTPMPVRTGIASAVSNAYQPVTIFNAILQGDRQKAADSTVRFLLNTTVGFAGFVDVASMANLPLHNEDFGQTLALSGVPSGPYLVVPVLGPATPRHLMGRGVDSLVTPLNWILRDAGLAISASPTMASTVTQREDALETVDDLEKTSPDFYASVKSIYTQVRQTSINDTASEEPATIAGIRQAGLQRVPPGDITREAVRERELSR